jgi:prepilin-type N-terminal cleavage/methylation domain-containing protein
MKKGFSFIELAIALTLLGLLVSGLLESYRIQKPEKIRYTMESQRLIVQSALDRYFMVNRRYPCPADPALPEEDAEAGKESACAAAQAIPVGTCGSVTPSKGGGLCHVPGAGETSSAGSVLTGSLPYAALGLAPADTYDVWNGKLGYAVTALMTSATDSGMTGGALRLRDSEGYDMNALYTADTIQRTSNTYYAFAVWSYGSSRRGAYTTHGVRHFDCTGQGLDLQNCDLDANFLFEPTDSDTRKTSAGFRSLARGDEFFDSYLVAYAQKTKVDNAWFTDVGRTSIESAMAMVGIGTPNPQVALQVESVNPASNGIRAPKTYANAYCNVTGDICFNIGGITGEYGDEGACAAGTALSGLSNGGPACPAFVRGGTMNDAFCTVPGEYVKGIDPATGGIICGTP